LIEQIGWEGLTLTDLERHVLIRKLIGILVTDSVTTISAKLQNANVQSPLDIQKLEYNVSGYSEAVQRRHRELKDFLYQNLYRHHRVMRMQKKSERVIAELFNAYVKEPAMLPKDYQKSFDLIGLERTVCDYIAGMTDRYAIEEHQKLFDPLTLP
jgi:dGTPase